MRLGPALAWGVFMMAAPAWAQRRASYAEPSLAITVPPGFETVPGESRHPAVIDTFRLAPRAARGPVVLQLLRLGGELPQRALRADERVSLRLGTPFPVDDRPESAQALGFAVPATVGRGRTPANAEIVRVAAVLPTPGMAVQVSVLARAGDERFARETLRAVLASARAETTWRSRAQRVFLGLATLGAALGAMGTLVTIVRVLLEGRTTHLGPRAQRRIAGITGLGWAGFAGWLLFPLEGAEWAAAVPVVALAITFLARAWAPSSAR